MIDLSRGCARGARYQAADIRFVRQAHAETNQDARLERRRYRDEIRHMRAATLVGIIRDEAFARIEARCRVAGEYRLHRLLIGGEMILQAAADDDDPALGIS